MKTLLLIISITLVNVIFAQEKIIFFDTLTQSPVKNVHVYSSNELLTLSNENGEIELSNSLFPFGLDAGHPHAVKTDRDVLDRRIVGHGG